MPEPLIFEDLPRALVENHVEPFREEYIPGSKVVSREWSSNGYEVFFQMPTPLVQNMDPHELEALKGQVRGWWRDRTNQMELSRRSSEAQG